MVIKSKKQEEQEELQRNIKIKPKLRKFVIDEQRKNAEQLAKERKKEETEILSRDDVLQRASQLASIAILKNKIWQKYPPYFEWNWTQTTSEAPQYQQEMHADIAGFALYLVREYNNWLKYKALSRGYLQPMDEKNLEFFWQKWNADLKLLIEAEQRRVAAGNKSMIISQMPTRTDIIIPGEKGWKN